MKSHTLIIGTAGTGKTKLCLEKYLQYAGNAFCTDVLFILPTRRAINNIEKELIKLTSNRTIISSQIFTFADVIANITKKIALPVPEILSNTKKILLLDDLINKLSLDYFNQSARFDGFIQLFDNFLRESGESLLDLDSFKKSVDDVKKSKKYKVSFINKLKDLLLIYSEYSKYLKKLDFIDSEGLSAIAIQELKKDATLFSNIKLMLVDGFAHYTRAQLEILKNLLDRIPEAVLTLCYEKDDIERFAYIEETYNDLKKITKWNEKILEKNHRTKSNALLHIEKKLFKGKECSSTQNQDDIILLEGRNKKEEIRLIASEILKLHFEKGIHFESMGILYRTPCDYPLIISNIFGEFGIPVTFQGNNLAVNTRIIDFINSIYDFIQNGYSIKKIINILKSGLLDFRPEYIDAFEEYVKREGIISGEDWEGKWDDCSDKNVLKIKEKLLEIITPFKNIYSKNSAPSELSSLLYDTLNSTSLINKIVRTGLAQENKNIQSTLSTIGDEISALTCAIDEVNKFCELTEKKTLELGQFIKLLNLAYLRSYQGYSSSAGSVHVSNVFEARSPEYDVVFVIGLTGKNFPAIIKNDPILKDSERAILRKYGFDLPPNLRRIYEERYLFYIACTRASKKLFLSYPMSDDEGKQAIRSHYIDEVESVVTIMQKNSNSNISSAVENISTLKDLQILASSLLYKKSSDANEKKEIESAVVDIYNYLVRDSLISSEAFLYGRQHEHLNQPPKLSDTAIAKIQRSDKTYYLAITSLEIFAECPFKYFCEKTLRLEPMQILDFTPLEAGSAVHEALRKIFSDAYQSGKNDAENIPREGARFLENFINKNYGKLLSMKRKSIEINRLRRSFNNFLELESEFQKSRKTEPAYFELKFGYGKNRGDEDKKSTEEPLTLDCGDGIKGLLSGKIDRVDILNLNNKKFGVVIDYKLNKNEASIKFDDGTVLQIPLYLRALKNLFKIEPVAGFYYSIYKSKRRGLFIADFSDHIRGTAKGIKTIEDSCESDSKNSDQFNEIIESVISKTKEYIRRIHSGDISFGDGSSKACSYCNFNRVCRRN